MQTDEVEMVFLNLRSRLEQGDWFVWRKGNTGIERSGLPRPNFWYVKMATLITWKPNSSNHTFKLIHPYFFLFAGWATNSKTKSNHWYHTPTDAWTMFDTTSRWPLKSWLDSTKKHVCIYIYMCVCIHIIGTCTVRYNTGWCLLTPMQRSQMAIVVPNIPYMIETFWTRIHIYIIYIYNIIYSYYYHSYYYSYTYIYRYICIFKTCRIHQPEHNPHPNRQKTSKLVARRSWQEKGFLWTISAAAAGQRDFTFGMYQSQNRFTWLHPTQL